VSGRPERSFATPRGHNLPSAPNQQAQDLEWLVLELNGVARLTQLAARQVHFKEAERTACGFCCGEDICASLCRAIVNTDRPVQTWRQVVLLSIGYGFRRVHALLQDQSRRSLCQFSGK